ncbi:hypothetical protein IQ255_15295 [Pleurocapsales cyanobacterium LEGE 10410]|nr:hypothetical protein [Pleurocapsales cyanobacterium LEGE 10410]
MLVNRYQTVYLSLVSTDLPVWDVIEAKASLYQKDRERFHLLLERQNLPCSVSNNNNFEQELFWLEISPHRVMMSVQNNKRLNYRHFWQRGIYGVSRYCLNSHPDRPSQSLRLRNFTRYLKVENDPLPKNVRIEYEMWSRQVHLGSYVFNLDLQA